MIALTSTDRCSIQARQLAASLQVDTNKGTSLDVLRKIEAHFKIGIRVYDENPFRVWSLDIVDTQPTLFFCAQPSSGCLWLNFFTIWCLQILKPRATFRVFVIQDDSSGFDIFKTVCVRKPEIEACLDLIV